MAANKTPMKTTASSMVSSPMRFFARYILPALTVIALLVMYFGVPIVSRLLADASSGGIIGSGVDVLVQTPAPTAGGSLALEVSARGGTRTGVRRVLVSEKSTGTVLADVKGRGATWGRTMYGNGAGQDSVYATFTAPDDADSVRLHIVVDYVIAKTSGAMSFFNVDRRDHVDLEIQLVGPGERWVRMCLYWLGPVLSLAAWFLVLSFAFRAWDHISAVAVDDGNFMTPLSFLALGGLVGYWTSVRPVMDVLGLHSEWTTALGTLVWIFVPWFLVGRSRRSS